MTEAEIRKFVNENNIDKNSQLLFEIQFSDGNQNLKGRIEFNFDGTPNITNGNIGIRYQPGYNSKLDVPFENGIPLDNLITIKLNG